MPINEASTDEEAPAREPRLVLVIEDSPEFLEVLCESLEAWGHRVLGAQDGATGLRLFHERAPDLVICDLRIPAVHGLEVLAAVKKSGSAAPFIVVSGASAMSDAVQALRLGAFDFISKPVEIEAVRHAVGRAFERMDLLEENQRYRQSLEDTVARRTEELRRRQQELEEANAALTHEVRERRRAEEERTRLEAEMRQGQKMEAIGTLASGVAHDFNNLLTAIIGNLVLLGDVVDSEQGRRYIQEAESACMRATGLVRQMLTLSRRTDPDVSPVDLNVVVDEMHRLVRETFDRRIDFFVDKAANMPSVLGDHAHLSTLLLNLVINARDAVLERLQAAETSGPVEARITVRTREQWLEPRQIPAHADSSPGWHVILSVEDTGMGMTEAVQDRIFDPFFTTKPVEKGTGLGLSVVYGVVQQQGGWIDVRTAPNQGCAFTVYLPVAPQGKQVASAPDLKPKAVPLQGGTETLLLVDDESTIREVSNEFLSRLGYNVLLAADGREGQEVFLAEQDHIDLLILDLSMPHVSGNEMLREIRRVAPHLKAIVSSGSADAESTVTERVEAFVLKPFRPTELAAKIREVLDAAEEVSGREAQVESGAGERT